MNNVTYYKIDEEAARRAKEMNSFYAYKPGRATEEYKTMVDKAAEIAEEQKERVDPIYHEKIDRLLDTYSRKLAENINSGYEIDARVPSVMIAGSDPDAVEKLKKKLEALDELQETMKFVNDYYHKNSTLDKCPFLTQEQIQKLKSDMESNWHYGNAPYLPWQLSNNSAEIRRVKKRIEELERKAETIYVGWQFEGGHVEPDKEANRLRIFFDEKPDKAVCSELSHSGFRWSPRANAWQRQITANAFYAADRIQCIQPLTGEKPSELQRKAGAD